MPRLVSIFSGAGGIDLGFHLAGFETIVANDNWKVACDTFIKNNPQSKVICGSIAEVDFSKIKQEFGEIDGLVGGPPCPPFSKSRFYLTDKKRGIEDESGFLTVSNYFRALEELNPKFFFFENVAGFVFKPHKDALEMVKSESERLGYKIVYKVVNAANYGVPQIRQRFICVGVKKGMDDFIYPPETHSENADKGLTPWVTCGDVLNDIDFDLPEDINKLAGSKHKDLLPLVPPGDNYLFFTAERGYPNPIFKWRSRYWSFLLKLSPSKPSWTIQASFSNNMGPFHWKNRFLRIQEIKRIQSFPDEYIFEGKFSDQWRQIGNAVPPVLVKAFAEQIKKQYFNG
jgi:DNA (cytosine-5)-methyltransferase 1